MDPFDQETEGYLREFQPRAIKPFRVEPKGKNIFARPSAVVAVMVLLAGVSLWFAHRELSRPKVAASIRTAQKTVARERRYPSTLALTRLALEDNEKLESLLAEESRRVFPAFQGKQGTLGVLANDY